MFYKGPILLAYKIDSNAQIQKQRNIIRKSKEEKVQRFYREQNILLSSKNYDYRDNFQIPMYLINSVYQTCKLSYNWDKYFYTFISTNNKIHHEEEKLAGQLASTAKMVKKTSLLDAVQLLIFDTFNSDTSIHFELYKQELSLQVKIIPHLVKTIGGQQYRADKDVYETILEEQWGQVVVLKEGECKVEGELSEIYDMQHMKKGIYQFKFLNVVDHLNLHFLESPPYDQNLPRAVQRTLNFFYIMREMVFDALDYLHTKHCCDQVLHMPDEKPSSEFSNTATIPSPHLRMSLPFPPKEKSEITEKDIVSENILRQAEKKIKQISTRRLKRVTQTAESRYFVTEVVKDSRMAYYSGNNEIALAQNIKLYDQQVNIQVARGNEPGLQYLDSITKAGAFWKLNGRSMDYNMGWLELRGFHVLWYRHQKNSSARGIGLLDEIPIFEPEKEKELSDNYNPLLQVKVRGEPRIFSVPLTNRNLVFKVDQSQVGAFWRRLLANQIAYKTYLNCLVFHLRIVSTFNKQQLTKNVIIQPYKILYQLIHIYINIDDKNVNVTKNITLLMNLY